MVRSLTASSCPRWSAAGLWDAGTLSDVLRATLVVFALVLVACAADAILLLQRGGSYLTGLKLLAVVLLGLMAAALISSWPRGWVYAAPFLGLGLFRGVVVHLVSVPEDAVIRDAQVGLAVFVVAVGQLLFVSLALAVAPIVRRAFASRRKA